MLISPDSRKACSRRSVPTRFAFVRWKPESRHSGAHTPSRYFLAPERFRKIELAFVIDTARIRSDILTNRPSARLICHFSKNRLLRHRHRLSRSQRTSRQTICLQPDNQGGSRIPMKYLTFRGTSNLSSQFSK